MEGKKEGHAMNVLITLMKQLAVKGYFKAHTLSSTSVSRHDNTDGSTTVNRYW